MDALRSDLCCANIFKSYPYAGTYWKTSDSGADYAMKVVWYPIMRWGKVRHVLDGYMWRYLLANSAQFWTIPITWVHMASPLRQGEPNWIAKDLDVQAP